MESPVIVRHGAVLRQLPPGFRFHPTDEELVMQYLRRKVLSVPLPAAVIPEIDLGKYDPWDLPDANEGERYFFTLQEARHMKGNTYKRATASGYWKATGKEKPILYTRSKLLVGMKRVLVFHREKPRNATRTEWMMHEYRLIPNTVGFSNAQQKNATVQNCTIEPKNWVVCRIYRKNRSQRSDEEIRPYYINNPVPINHAIVIHYLMQQRQNALQPASSSTSSSSSCVTDIVDQEVNSIDNAISQREA